MSKTVEAKTVEAKTVEAKTVEAKTVEAKTVELPDFVIAKGKSIVTLKGIKVAGEEVKKEHFKLEETFNDLKKKKFIVKP